MIKKNIGWKRDRQKKRNEMKMDWRQYNEKEILEKEKRNIRENKRRLEVKKVKAKEDELQKYEKKSRYKKK